MLRKKLKQMIEQQGKKKTKKIIEQEIKDLENKMRKVFDIYSAIDIEHEILDRKSMLKWLKQNV